MKIENSREFQKSELSKQIGMDIYIFALLTESYFLKIIIV